MQGHVLYQQLQDPILHVKQGQWWQQGGEVEAQNLAEILEPGRESHLVELAGHAPSKQIHLYLILYSLVSPENTQNQR